MKDAGVAWLSRGALNQLLNYFLLDESIVLN